MEGLAIFRFFKKHKIKAILHDFSSGLDELKQSFWSSNDYLSEKEKEKIWQEILEEKQNLQLKNNYLKDIEKADLIFVPQSWFRYSQNEPLKRIKKKIPFCQITELYFKFFPGIIIGVTGSSGKSTTCALIFHLLKNLKGRDVWLSGNDRQNPPVLHKIEKAKKNDILILEISNRQLIDLKCSPKIAVLATISPTHLDDHKDFKEYLEVKKNIIRYQKPNDLAILNYENKYTRSFAKETKAQVLWFGLHWQKKLSGAFLKKDELVFNLQKTEKIIRAKELQLRGSHNILNCLSSSLVAKKIGLRTQEISQKLKEFTGLKHRLELVGKINGAEFYNDSQATNPQAAQAAIETFPGKEKIVIAGGKAKPNPADFREWLSAMWENQVKALFLIGEAKDQIENVFKEIVKKGQKPELKMEKCTNLEEAVKKAISKIKDKTVVLMSPACESFGEFKDYRERGNQFRELIKKYSK